MYVQLNPYLSSKVVESPTQEDKVQLEQLWLQFLREIYCLPEWPGWNFLEVLRLGIHFAYTTEYLVSLFPSKPDVGSRQAELTKLWWSL